MQQIVISDEKGACITEVKDVLSFSDKEIKLSLGQSAKRLVIEGAGLKITGFSKSSGEFSVEGRIYSARYLGAKEGFLKRVFK